MLKESWIRWVGNVAHFRRKEGYRVVGGNPEGERMCEGWRHRWEVDIKMCIKEIGGVHGLD